MENTIIKTPFISRVIIKNFRNFKDVDVNLSNKQVILGENNIGKTNFIRALQLILDPSLSDSDRYLEESDFNDTLESPFDNKAKIEISIEIQGLEHNTPLLSMFGIATVSKNPPTILISYEYIPAKGRDYEYIIYLNGNKDLPFTHQHRKLLNIKVIKGLRDANSDFRNIKKSPFNQLLKRYEFDKEAVKEIAQNMKEKGDAILDFEELMDLKEKVNRNIVNIIGNKTSYSKVSLETVDINPDRILNTLQLMVGSDKQRPTTAVSLGVTNILYISLILLSLEDQTIPTLIPIEELEMLSEIDEENILQKFYQKKSDRYYKLKEQEKVTVNLYEFFSANYKVDRSNTILVIEEPEAHLHPILQRCIFRDVMSKSMSVILTTHSSDITSVSPIDSIVHLRQQDNSVVVHSTKNINLLEKEKLDVERYMDVKRSELYFGKAVILVEGIAEEYLIPRLALNLGIDLDFLGIVCCNINSTNFTPYIKLLKDLHIPFIIFTDGDYYRTVQDNSGKKPVIKREYHLLKDDSHSGVGYLGQELALDTLIELGIFSRDNSYTINEFNKEGYYFSDYTLEIDLMMVNSQDEEASETICGTFEELTAKGDQQKNNFRKDFESGDYYSCLRKIENSQNKIGKGRFAQRLSLYPNILVPEYIKQGLNSLATNILGDSSE
nr:AAA family ATPase [Terribacillus saccharophilus]